MAGVGLFRRTLAWSIALALLSTVTLGGSAYSQAGAGTHVRRWNKRNRTLGWFKVV